MATVILGNDFGVKICNQLGIDAGMVRRIIIDIKVNDAVKVYIDSFGAKSLLTLDLPEPRFVDIVENVEDEWKRINEKNP